MENNMLLFVGSYTNKHPSGINIFTFNEKDGSVIHINAVDGIKNPSFISIDEKNNHLFAVSETAMTDDKEGGQVFSYEVCKETGKLTYLSAEHTNGGAPCHLSVDNNGKNIYVVNYSGGNLCRFSVDETGHIRPFDDLVQHSGKSVRTDRQEGPHPHSIILDKLNRFAYVPDLGLDKIFIYQLDQERHSFIAFKEINVHLGAGPRHLVFHPNLPYAYVINELDCTICAFSVEMDGTLKMLQTIPSLIEFNVIEDSGADIHIAPNGKFLYASNRGADSITIFKINQEDGSLTRIGICSTYGKTPRNFAITPNGKFLFAANQNSDSIVIFKIDEETGLLTKPINTINVSEPVCIKFFI
ncbi:lactonase family protein [Bacillus sp. FJAT-49732]|uniref:Lactonase family protein n=1 Tax=Lederbergia citrisecunda TaxID=2833583 RepID=A0A942YLP7_9BACI|nr:lactonase family protein [Lederbergia citrisecunda]MBS4199865.1 lactonase family protein [Lederbergia citrisecunda]